MALVYAYLLLRPLFGHPTQDESIIVLIIGLLCAAFCGISVSHDKHKAEKEDTPTHESKKRKKLRRKRLLLNR